VLQIRHPNSINGENQIYIPDSIDSAIIKPEHIDFSTSNRANDETDPTDVGGIVGHTHQITGFHFEP
jgi:hypothetical protein